MGGIDFIDNRMLDPARLKELLNAMLDSRRERVMEQRQCVAGLCKKEAEAQQKLSRLYQAIEDGFAAISRRAAAAIERDRTRRRACI